MSSTGISTGLKALFAAQIALQTTGNNIANAHVKGYSRQHAMLVTDRPIVVPGVGFIGTGVRAAGIARTVDELLEARLRTQEQSLGRLKKDSSLLAQIETLYDESTDTGLSTLFSRFFSTVNGLAIDPTDPTLRADVVMSSQVLSDGFNNLSTNLNNFRDDIEDEMEGKVDEINQYTEEIHELNQMILGTLGANMNPNDLMDRRTQAIKELSSIVEVQVRDTTGNGEASILIGGRIVVGPGFQKDIEYALNASGDAYFHLDGDTNALSINNGELKALIYEHNTKIPALLSKADTLAGQFIYEFNKIHSTGIPGNGPFTFLKAETATQDLNVNLDPTDELLTEAGLAFPPVAGSLWVTVTNQNTGEMVQTEVQITPSTQSLTTFAQALNAIPNLNAYADSQGYLTLNASQGFAFDFAPNLNTHPDGDNTFGDSAATVTGGLPSTFPATMVAGDSLVFTVDGSALPAVTFAAGSYTASGIASEINSQTGTSIASVVDGRLVVKSTSSGSTSTLQISNASGTPATTLGLSTALETGADLQVTVEMEGVYTGSSNANWRFEASGAGTIGVTDNLTISVYNDSNVLVGQLDVGPNYSPGDMIEVADGVSVSFTSGDISNVSGDFFTTDLLTETDSSGILASLGMNTFFTGSTAGDINVRSDVVDNPGLIAAGLSPSEGDNSNVLRMGNLMDTSLTGLGSKTIIQHYSNTVGQLGLDKRWADDMFEIQELVVAGLENERASISGVSIDEELLNLEQYQQMLEAATQYLQIIYETSRIVMSLGSR
ncbi:MAG: flagellar hook-associated protein FlgK [Planctomycetota bacterium]